MGDSEAVEQFLVLYKSAEGKSIELLIKELVAHESIFSFGKFLEQPKIVSREAPKASYLYKGVMWRDRSILIYSGYLPLGPIRTT